MLRISDESYERVQDIIEDMSCCCEFEDDYDQWEDIAASSMASFLDDLDGEQLEMTVAALEKYIIDKADNDLNMAMGVKTALARYIRERIEYLDIHVVPDVKINTLNSSGSISMSRYELSPFSNIFFPSLITVFKPIFLPFNFSSEFICMKYLTKGKLSSIFFIFSFLLVE